MRLSDDHPDGFALMEPIAGEFANSVTHGFGFLLSLLGVLAIVMMSESSSLGLVIASGVYATSLVAVYAVSTLSHAISRPEAKYVLRVWDQGVIYLLIAGTYTPFMAAYLTSHLRWVALALLWAAALTGFYFKVVARRRVNQFSSRSYVLLGWVPAMSLLFFVPWLCLTWMALGGLSYTAGVWFLRMQNRNRYFHAVWHMMVILGSGCHFYAVFTFVLLRNAAA